MSHKDLENPKETEGILRGRRGLCGSQEGFLPGKFKPGELDIPLFFL